MNLIIPMILMILSRLLGPLVKAVESGLCPDFRGPGTGPKVASLYRQLIVKWPFFGPWWPDALGGLLPGLEEIGYRLIVLMIRMMHISPLIWMNLIKPNGCIWIVSEFLGTSRS